MAGGLEFDSHHHTQPFQNFYYEDGANIWAIELAGMALAGWFGQINRLKWVGFISGSGLENSVQPAIAIVTGFGSVGYLHGPNLTSLLQSQSGTQAGSRPQPKFVALKLCGGTPYLYGALKDEICLLQRPGLYDPPNFEIVTAVYRRRDALSSMHHHMSPN